MAAQGRRFGLIEQTRVPDTKGTLTLERAPILDLQTRYSIVVTGAGSEIRMLRRFAYEGELVLATNLPLQFFFSARRPESLRAA
uniref:hypothetical protein n=1 Tax=Cupriavidus taiwanensis TaxID=164546 RepID=UPI003F49AF64